MTLIIPLTMKEKMDVSPHHTTCWQTKPSQWWKMKWRLCSQSAICSFWILPNQSNSSEKRTDVEQKKEQKFFCSKSGKCKILQQILQIAIQLGSCFTSKNIHVHCLCTLTVKSREKKSRQMISMVSVRPQGGCQGGERCRGSEEKDREEGRSTNASNNTTAMVRPKPLEQ